jgi:hypothetical protein
MDLLGHLEVMMVALQLLIIESNRVHQEDLSQ